MLLKRSVPLRVLSSALHKWELLSLLRFQLKIMVGHLFVGGKK